MSEPDQPPTPDRLPDLLEEGAYEETVACLDRLDAADTETRKRVLRAVRDVATDRPRAIEDLTASLSTFLTDDDRAVKLTTAKLFVTLAQSEPEIVVPVVDALAERLADEEVFYYVRARSAEALGYVGRDHPEAVSDPEILADFRIGLSFDEPEVKEKLAKALECVSLGDPGRLRHQVESLAEHLDDDGDLVRYHLCTALTAVGCEDPAKLAAARAALGDRLSDESEDPYIRGRAAEALGLFGRVDGDYVSPPDAVDVDDEDAADFVASRVAFLRGAREDKSGDEKREVATLDGLRDSTEGVAETMTTTDGEECPHCGLALPESGPPMCPRCGVPR
ncbi:HEAT repeat domain-containing protein [Haloarcula rubripromontorii]|uniref:Phycocyanin alpha phycocyanobilin lyase n=1 Tax=Haloarcula rubripromontorii TaxID=1705562 RepID=A0A847U6R6_9EURY|nr:HEAT repeat domain-containing protein [Haloarcula rubripromontorii]NLV07997.1 hypothetical protein [Haloarcula rubripromontorii]